MGEEDGDWEEWKREREGGRGEVEGRGGEDVLWW